MLLVAIATVLIALKFEETEDEKKDKKIEKLFAFTHQRQELLETETEVLALINWQVYPRQVYEATFQA